MAEAREEYAPGTAPYKTMLQAAAWFGVSLSTVKKWYDKGEIDGFRTGNQAERDEHGRIGTCGARRIYINKKARNRLARHRKYMRDYGRV